MVSNMSENATILVKNETRNLMKKIARKDQTYNDLILELIKLRQNQKEYQN
jgi:hypothetical protein